MRRFVLMLLLLVAPLPAFGSGMALRWNSCRGESNRNFACDISTGSELLVGSFEAPGTVNLSGVEVYMRITTSDGVIPSWWQMVSAGSCRQTSLSFAFDMSTEADCEDPWQGQAGGGLGWYDTRSPATWPTSGSGGVFVKFAMAVPSTAVQPVSGGRQFAAFRMSINHSRSHGPAACEGCSTPACIVLECMRLTSPVDQSDKTRPSVSNDVDLTDGISGMGGVSNVVTWQGGTPTCGAGAAKPSSWSQLKRRFK